MDRRTFGILCDLLRQDGRVKTDGLVSVEEQNCLGALDGTHIDVHVPEIDKPRYRTRKGRVATNVLGVCSGDMQFIYVFPGWEGSASDSRVLHDAISRPNGFKVPADGGYTNGEGFLAPYRGIPYHLSEWEGRTPSNKEEYFNMKHSKARNVIERCFGLLKGRQEMSVDPMENLPIIEDGQNTEEGMDNENILNATQEPKGRRRKWEAFEEEVLLGVLEDFVARKQRCDTGAFKQGTLVEIAKAVNVLCPHSNIKANPHIESKLKKWKKTYSMVVDMINTSGFAWNDVKKCVEVDSDDAWQTYVQRNKEADGWRSKPFPLFDRFAYIFGKDRATGNVAETPAQMVEEQSHDHVGESDIGGDNFVSSMNQQSQQSTPSENSQRKRKRAVGSSSDGTEAIISGLKDFYVESGKMMQMVTEALVQGTADHTDIANELEAMGLSPMDQIDALSLILDKPKNVGVFRAIKPELKKVFVQRLLSDNARG
ncbi:hypothetical protein ACFX2K_030329 [Malus domestica]